MKVQSVSLSHDSSVLLLTSLDGGAGSTGSKAVFGPASARLHLQPLCKAAENLGLHPRLLSLDVDKPGILNRLGTPRVCVVGKINHHDDYRVEGFAMATLAAVSRLRAAGVTIVVSYCDNLAPLSCSRGSLYRDLLRLADHLVVPCQAMASLAARWKRSGLPISVIEDPWQVRLQPYPTLQQGEPLRIVWFGNTNNVHFLCKEISRLTIKASVAPRYHLDVLSSSQALKMAKEAFDSATISAKKHWSLRLIPWDKSAQPRQLEDILGTAHVAWLPSDPTNIIKSGVSHNRLVDSVRSGCIPIASPMVSYVELRRLALIGTDHGQILDRLVPHYSRLAAKHEGLRDSLLTRFCPTTNLKSWENFLGGLLDNKKAST